MPINNAYKTAATAALLTAVILGSTACSYSSKDDTPKGNSVTPTGTFAGSYYEKNAITDKEGKYWIPLKPAAASIGYRMKDDTSSGGYTKLGYSDVMYMLRPDSSQVFSLGRRSPCRMFLSAAKVKSTSRLMHCPSCCRPRLAGIQAPERSILLPPLTGILLPILVQVKQLSRCGSRVSPMWIPVN